MPQAAWLVTGAAGFLGSNVAVGLGHESVIGTSRSQPAHGLFREWHQADLAEASDLIRRVKPSVVVNAAALSSHEACETDPVLARQVNAQFPGRMAAAAATVGARFVQISTDAVFSGVEGSYRETDTPAPFSEYGESKLAGEHEVLSANARALIVRTNFFGWSPSGKRSILEFFVGRLRAGEIVGGYTDFIVTSLYVQTLVQAITELIRLDVHGIVHVASSDAASKFTLGRSIAQTFGLDESLVQATFSASGRHRTDRSRDLSLDTSLAASLLGRSLPTQRDGVLAASMDERALRSRFSSA